MAGLTREYVEEQPQKIKIIINSFRCSFKRSYNTPQGDEFLTRRIHSSLINEMEKYSRIKTKNGICIEDNFSFFFKVINYTVYLIKIRIKSFTSIKEIKNGSRDRFQLEVWTYSKE